MPQPVCAAQATADGVADAYGFLISDFAQLRICLKPLKHAICTASATMLSIVIG